ncbi:hypothetical protein SteCoe_29727 [Stentor coeruleus]|uniref:Protein kinase domain-containing protein n=1 Tax=Stentor coeruleus TaxID=5963 RepID=A0A1R2B5B1_9CILI|nr:hypothetical protein SteCoe_29727 [Stentor coeruleus]
MSIEEYESIIRKMLPLFIPTQSQDNPRENLAMRKITVEIDKLFKNPERPISNLESIVQDYNAMLEYDVNDRNSRYIKEQRILLFYKYIQYLYGDDLNLDQYIALIKVVCMQPSVEGAGTFIEKLKRDIFNGFKSDDSLNGVKSDDSLNQSKSDPNYVIELVRKNVTILDRIKEYYTIHEMVTEKKLLGYPYEKCLLKLMNEKNGPSLKKIFNYYYLQYEELIGMPFQLINFELKKRIREYFKENSNDLVKCERFLYETIPDKFKHKEALRKELLQMFIRNYSGMVVVNLNHINHNEIKFNNYAKSSKYNINVLSTKIPEEMIRFDYNSKTELIQHLINDLTIFLRLNQFNTGITFLGIWLNTPKGINLGFCFEDFGEPLYEYCKKIKQNDLDFKEGKMFYLIKEMAIKAQRLLDDGFFIEFLHPGNVFIKDYEVIVFPNCYAISAYSESSKVDTKMFKIEESIDLKKYLENTQSLKYDKNEYLTEQELKKGIISELNKSLAYSLGIMALYFKTSFLDLEHLAGNKDEIINSFKPSYSNAIRSLLGEKGERKSITELANELE